MKLAVPLFVVALLSAEQASAFSTKGLSAISRVPTAASSPSVLNASFNEVIDSKIRKEEKKAMTKARKEDIMKTKLFGSALLSAALYLGSAFTGMAALTASPEPASAAESKVVGQLKGSGLIFKDTLSIERFEDPKVKGVVLYISNFDRPVTEKFSKGNFFNDPSYASVACARTGQNVAIASNINKTPQGEEVFEESRSLLFKTLRVQRVYDEEKKTVVYVSYNTRLDKGDDSNKSRFKSSLCAINLDDYNQASVDAATTAAKVPAAVTP
mmetsp:Transcript_11506/g.27465  ORF Transcript_11506/g.27465 Transcript_11506/m.27465 type:complete len:270 (+) Transcript_11506:144-953(+)|eukprot:CAMPEP_0197194580 /NCGR_PEP_ID=MMETSP1423-20130617/29506_1 /TAXON_ID=476441 /ORGANISM="Pseudo-nitzschia heimii, Strain UNC1101" /LENGTH=269 /DNA_ID=CAMNT_0042648025 /DNA_START=72 /DNA_END=881 /DNA_ORIENTATION=+